MCVCVCACVSLFLSPITNNALDRFNIYFLWLKAQNSFFFFTYLPFFHSSFWLLCAIKFFFCFGPFECVFSTFFEFCLSSAATAIIVGAFFFIHNLMAQYFVVVGLSRAQSTWSTEITMNHMQKSTDIYFLEKCYPLFAARDGWKYVTSVSTNFECVCACMCELTHSVCVVFFRFFSFFTLFLFCQTQTCASPQTNE